MFSVDCKWSIWGQWTSCSKSCGVGKQTRKRTKATIADNGGKECAGPNNARRSCIIKKCRG